MPPSTEARASRAVISAPCALPIVVSTGQKLLPLAWRGGVLLLEFQAHLLDKTSVGVFHDGVIELRAIVIDQTDPLDDDVIDFPVVILVQQTVFHGGRLAAPAHNLRVHRGIITTDILFSITYAL